MLDPDIKESVLEHTKSVLKNNWQGNYTIPAKGLYPHQWLWDSCFIAIGYANYDLENIISDVNADKFIEFLESHSICDGIDGYNEKVRVCCRYCTKC